MELFIISCELYDGGANECVVSATSKAAGGLAEAEGLLSDFNSFIVPASVQVTKTMPGELT